MELVDTFEEFFKGYYNEEIKELASKYPQEQRSLFVDWMDLYRFDPDLADDVLARPDKILEAAEEALRHYDLPIDISLDDVHVRIRNLNDAETYNIDEFSPSRKDGQLVSLSAQVAKKTKVAPIPEEIAYECQLCGTITRVRQSTGSFDDPHECQGCERQGPFIEKTALSTKEDYQKVRLTQPPEQTNGEQGQLMDVRLRDDLVDHVNAGDRVDLVGQFCLEQPPAQSNKETYDMIVEGLAADVKQTDYEEIEITPQLKQRIKEIAGGEYGDPYELFIGSIAPTIKGEDDLKEGLALSLFSGVRVEHGDGTNTRGDIHVLMIGDPGTAKTTLLDAMSELAPRSVQASGRGATVAGMTATAKHDEFGDGRWALDAGALVIGHKGVATIDEIDKLGEGVEEALHDAMASQKVSVNKAGINTTLPSETTVVAGGNPKYGRFNVHEPINEQIEIGPTLLSRFDLIYTLRDRPDEERDRMIAKSKIQSKEDAKRNTSGDEGSPLEIAKAADDPSDSEAVLDLLRAYVAYAKRNIDPVIEDDAVARELEDAYVDIRIPDESAEDAPVPITARKLDAFQRVAEASARIRLSETIEQEDVARAKKRIRDCLESVGVDPDTGEFDVDMIEVDTSQSQRERIKNVKDVIADVAEEHDEGAPVGIVLSRANEIGINESKAEHEIENLKQKGEVYEPSMDHLRTT